MSMKNLIFLVVAISCIFYVSSVEECDMFKKDSNGKIEYAIIPNSEEDCTTFNVNDPENNNCCYVSWKNQGKYYAMCRILEKSDLEGKIKDLKKELKKEFEDIHIMCSSKYIYFSLILAIITCLIL